LGITPGTGAAIEVELWALNYEDFGRFVAEVPPPLAIGTVTLADGRKVKGFLVEAQATIGAEDISKLGGWRAFVAGKSYSDCA
jgi:allophanate hydrolase